jgi:hypothetical protein
MIGEAKGTGTTRDIITSTRTLQDIITDGEKGKGITTSAVTGITTSGVTGTTEPTGIGITADR